MARPSKLTPEMIETFAEWVRIGNTITNSARLCRVDYSTVLDWMQRGEAGDTPLHQAFYEAVIQADSQAEARAVAQWQKINQDTNDYRAVQGLLTHRHKWAAPSKVEISGPDGGPIKTNIDLDKLSVEELKSLEEMMSKATEDKK
jgi:hypothetical protein